MEILSMQFLSALMAIIVIDLVLAGDNAIVIGLAARNLPLLARLLAAVRRRILRLIAVLLGHSFVRVRLLRLRFSAHRAEAE